MAKTTYQRRLKRRAEDLGELFQKSPQEFRLGWARLFDEWIGEVRYRAHAQMRYQAAEPIPAIYGVLDHARRLARAVGAEHDSYVADSLRHLEHACALAVAGVTDPCLYRFRTDCTVRLGW
jgi:hypothetical protein